MADYWKSQARKFCDFCKCWIADNKPSIQYHENGKRHKENVAKKISELAKKSAKQHKESIKLDDEMKKMEEEALKAYMEDIQMNRDYSSQQLKEKLNVEEKIKTVEEKKVIKEEFPPKKLWYEGKSAEGHKYYWNIETAESKWEPPEEGYVSLEEQQNEAELQERLAKVAKEEREEELRAWKQREKMKKFRKPEEKKVEETKEDEPLAVMGPASRKDPYGAWTTVKRVEVKPVDLQLPHQNFVDIKVPSLSEEEPKLKIKEKRLTTLDLDQDVNVPSTFKKRKPNPGRLNIRQRLDDDDNN